MIFFIVQEAKLLYLYDNYLTSGNAALKVVCPIKTSRIFISRLNLDFPVEAMKEFVTEMTGNDCSGEAEN